MNLREFCCTQEITLAKIAKEIKYSPVTLRLVNTGGAKPGKHLLEKLESFSNGLITKEHVLQRWKEKHLEKLKKKENNENNLRDR